MKTKTNHYLLGIAFALLVLITWSCKKTFSTPGNTPPNDTTSGPKPDSTLYTVSGTGGQDTGQILLAFNNKTNGVLAILDQNGNVLKEKNTALKVEDFQKWNINGVTYYTYFQTQGTYTIAGITSTEEGYDIICDSNLNQISRTTLLPYENIDTVNYDKLDVHDFILLGANHYITIANRLENPKNIPDSLHPSSNVKVIACLIQEVNNGQVIFQWDGTNYAEFYGTSVENNNFSDSVNAMDYMHMNSLCIDPHDNNIICSFRNLNQIIKINRTTGNIMWRLGGKNSDFPLTPDQVFLRQHYARFTDNDQTLMFVDNGLLATRPYSRIVEFQLDENVKNVNNFHAYTIPDTFIQYAGSVKKENGTYFIGGGLSSYTLQVNYTTNEVLLRLNQKFSSYRALKY